MEVETDFEGLLDHIILKEKKNDEESELINIASHILSTNFRRGENKDVTTTTKEPNPAVVVAEEVVLAAIVAAAIAETPKHMEGVTDTTNEKQPPPAATGIDSATRTSKSSYCPKTPPHGETSNGDEEEVALWLRDGILNDPETPGGFDSQKTQAFTSKLSDMTSSCSSTEGTTLLTITDEHGVSFLISASQLNQLTKKEVISSSVSTQQVTTLKNINQKSFYSSIKGTTTNQIQKNIQQTPSQHRKYQNLKKVQPDGYSVSSTIATDKETTSTGRFSKRKRRENEQDEAEWSANSVHNYKDYDKLDLNYFFLQDFPDEDTRSFIDELHHPTRLPKEQISAFMFA